MSENTQKVKGLLKKVCKKASDIYRKQLYLKFVIGNFLKSDDFTEMLDEFMKDDSMADKVKISMKQLINAQNMFVKILDKGLGTFCSSIDTNAIKKSAQEESKNISSDIKSAFKQICPIFKTIIKLTGDFCKMVNGVLKIAPHVLAAVIGKGRFDAIENWGQQCIITSRIALGVQQKICNAVN